MGERTRGNTRKNRLLKCNVNKLIMDSLCQLVRQFNSEMTWLKPTQNSTAVVEGLKWQLFKKRKMEN